MCKAIAVSNVADAPRKLGQTEVRNHRPNGGSKGRPNKIVSESGLYKLVMRSDKPEAKAFQDWVTGTVLPSIRKDGGYIMGEDDDRPDGL